MIYTKYCKIFLFFFIILIIFVLFSNKKEKFDKTERNDILLYYYINNNKVTDKKEIENRKSILSSILQKYPIFYRLFDSMFLSAQSISILNSLFNEGYKNTNRGALYLLYEILENKNLTIIHILKLYPDIFTKYFLENYKELNNLYNNIFKDILTFINNKQNIPIEYLQEILKNNIMKKDYFINALNSQKNIINKLNQTIKSWKDDKLIDEILKLYNSKTQKRNKFKNFTNKFNKNYLNNIINSKTRNKIRLILEILYNDLIDNRTGDVDNIDFINGL